MSQSFFLSNEPSLYPEIPDSEPFHDAEAAWFWCVQTSEAIHSGARMEPGLGTPRPCEAVDIQKVVLRLADQKQLNAHHVDALVKYGQRQLRPTRLPAAHYWHQAMHRMTPILQRKGIIA